MATSIQVLYFGDQTIEPYDSVKDLLKEIGTSETLSRFLQVSFDALQRTLLSSPPTTRNLFPGRDFAELIHNVKAHGRRHAAVSSFFSCVAQLGWTLL